MIALVALKSRDYVQPTDCVSSTDVHDISSALGVENKKGDSMIEKIVDKHKVNSYYRVLICIEKLSVILEKLVCDVCIRIVCLQAEALAHINVILQYLCLGFYKLKAYYLL